MQTTRTLVSFFALATAAACGSAQQTPDPLTVEAPAGVTEAALAGGWASDCVDPGSGQGFRLVFDLTTTTWGLDYQAFGDATCQQPSLTVHIEGDYALGDASTAVAGAREGRFGFAKKTVTPHNDGVAGFLAQACGRDGFAAGVAADITGGCAGLGAYPVAACPADHDIVLLTPDGALHFGARPADNDMCTPAKRPTAPGVPLRRR
jgi:hypothetical protein